jgi:hypothetical protein
VGHRRKKDRAFSPIAVLSGDHAPFCISAMLNGATIDNFDTYPVLNYGTNYKVSPDHKDQCEIGYGALLKKKGSFVLAGDDQYLVVGKHQQQGVRYFHLASGDLKGEPGGQLATFKSWSLNVPGLDPSVPILQIVRHSAV